MQEIILRQKRERETQYLPQGCNHVGNAGNI